VLTIVLLTPAQIFSRPRSHFHSPFLTKFSTTTSLLLK
jgi:hypothetical protein